MVALTNETQTMLSLLRIFKFNTTYYHFIIILLLAYGCFEKGHETHEKKYIYIYIYFQKQN